MKCIQIWVGKTIPPQIAQLTKTVEDKFSDYELIHIKHNFSNPNLIVDRLRCSLAIEEPDLVYVDCDVELFEKPDFTGTGKPYLAEHNGPRPDTFFFYVNGCNQFFLQLMLKATPMYPRRNWFFQNTRHERDKFFIIKNSTYKHWKGQSWKTLK